MNHEFHYIPRFEPKLNDLNSTGRKFEMERRLREPKVTVRDKKQATDKCDEEDDESDEEEDEVEMTEAEEALECENDHSIVCWDIETKQMPGMSA